MEHYFKNILEKSEIECTKALVYKGILLTINDLQNYDKDSIDRTT